MRIKKIINNLLPIALSTLLLFLIYKTLKIEKPAEVFGYINLNLILVSALGYLFIKIINSFRYKLFYDLPNLNLTFILMLVCNFLLNLLPFRVGELSYLKYFNDYFSVDYHRGVSRLMIVRLMDYSVVFLLAIVSGLFVGSKLVAKFLSLDLVSSYAGFVFLLCIVMTSFIFGTAFLLKKFFQKKFIKLIQHITRVKEEMLLIGHFDLLKLFLTSSLYWIARVSLGYVLLLLLDINPGYLVIVFISVFLMLLDLFPLKTFVGFGVFEGGFVTLLGLWGYEAQVIFPKILALHLVLVIPVLIFGICGYLFLRYFDAKNRSKI